MPIKRIFTFWEPRGAMPGYLKLCIETWRKFLPDYEIVVLDYNNLDQWLGKNCYPSSLYTQFSLPKQSDALRCAVLKRWGGVWLDADTIITSEKARDLLQPQAEFTLMGRHSCFIVAQKGAKILRIWEVCIRLHIFLYSFCQGKGYLARKLRDTLAAYLERWNFFIGRYTLLLSVKTCEKLFAKAFRSIDKIAVCAFPELSLAEGTVEEKYQKYYFSDNSIENAMNNGGILCLHNSWTPEEYQRMSGEDFLSQNIALAKILRHLLAQ